MALPENRIKKIKLPGDVGGNKTYEIIPEKVSDGSGNYAVLPSLSVDDTIVTVNTAQTISSTKTFKDNGITFIASPTLSTDWETVKIINSYNNPELKLTLGGGAGGSVEYTAGSIKKTVPGGASGDTTYTLSIPSKTGTLATTSDLTGFVTGPNSSTDNNIALFDGTTGKAIKSDDKISYYHADGTLFSAETSINLSRSFTYNSRQITETARYKTDGIELVNKAGSTTTVYRYAFPTKNGTLALTGDLPEVNDGVLTINKNGIEAGTFSANQDSDVDIDIDIIDKVENILNIPDNELGLYRFTEEVEGVTQSSHIYEAVKEDHGAEETEFYKVTETNGTQLTTSTFMSQFYFSLTNFVSCSAVSNVYAFYYDNEYVSQNGIRIGTKNTGSITLTLSEPGSIIFGKYFSYNGSTHAVTYDADSKVIVDGTDEYTFSSDTATVEVELAAGTHTITSNGQDLPSGGSAQGRILLLGFIFEGEPYSIYSKKALARVEEVQAVDTKLTQHITTSNTRFADDERAITANTGGITDINNRMGDIQVFQSQYNNLPTPSIDYVNKIYRDKNANALYQCVRQGAGASKTWDFANVNGTSEITSSNVSSFYGDAGNQFNSYLEVDYDGGTTKFYRNNGSLKLGSSSSTGMVEFKPLGDTESLPLAALKFGVKAYNTNGSTVNYEVELYNDDTGNYQYLNGEIFLSDPNVETLIDLTDSIPSGWTLSYLDISSVAQHNTGTEEEPVMVNNDKRLVISKLVLEIGEFAYKWVPAAMPMLAFTDSLKIKDIPIGGAYLYWPDDGSGILVYKYYDGTSTELYFQEISGYYEYFGDNIENNTVQDAYDNADWYGYALDSNVVHKTGNENIAGTKVFTDNNTYVKALKVYTYTNQQTGAPSEPIGTISVDTYGEFKFAGASGGSATITAGTSGAEITVNSISQSNGISFKDKMANSSGTATIAANYILPTVDKGATTAATYTIATLDDIPSISLTTTTGSEAITVDSDSLNLVTRDTTQVISSSKRFDQTGDIRFGPTGYTNTTSYRIYMDGADHLRIGDVAYDSGLGGIFLGGRETSSSDHTPTWDDPYIKITTTPPAQNTPLILFNDIIHDGTTRKAAKFVLPTVLKGVNGQTETVPTYTIATTDYVIANPSSTTATLSGITINGVNYSVSTSSGDNQRVKVGSTTFGTNDEINLVAGSNITLTPATTGDGAPKITIAATDTNTTYTIATGDNDGQIKVTPSSGDAYNVSVKGLGAAAYKGTTTSVTSGSADLVTSGAVYTAISDLPKAMIFRGTLGTGGTITSLPTASASNEGDTYKVITAGTYASQTAKVGDVFICGVPTGSSTYSWVLIPAGDTDTDTVRQVKVNGNELLGTAISTGYVNFKNGSNVTITGEGHDITIAATDTTYSEATTSAAGLMSAADKTSLDTIKGAYLKTASASGNTLTLTKQDDTTVTFSPETGGNVISVTLDSSTFDPTTGIGNVTITQADYNKAIDATKDCIIIVTIEDSVTLSMSRMSISDSTPKTASFIKFIDQDSLASMIGEVQNNSGTYRIIFVLREDGPSNFVRKLNNLTGNLEASLATSTSTSAGAAQYLEDISYTSASSSGTATASKSIHTHKVTASGTVSLGSNTTSSEGVAYVESISSTGASASGTAKAGSETHTHNYDKTTSVSLTANDSTATGRITYVQSISGGSGSLTSDDSSSGGIAYIASASHTAASLGTASTGTVSLSGGSGSLTSDDSSSGGIAYIASASHTAASLGTADTGTVTISGGSYSLTASRSTSGSGTAARRILTLAVSGSAPSLGGTTTFVTGYPNFSGGSATHTTKYLHHSHIGASLTGDTTFVTGYPNFSGGSASHTTKYLHHSHSGASATTKYLSAAPGYTSTASGEPSATTSFVTGVTGGTTSATTKYFHPSFTGTEVTTGQGTNETTSVVTGITAGSISKTTKYVKLNVTRENS